MSRRNDEPLTNVGIESSYHAPAQLCKRENHMDNLLPIETRRFQRKIEDHNLPTYQLLHVTSRQFPLPHLDVPWFIYLKFLLHDRLLEMKYAYVKAIV